jgi:hypothetical protein
VTGINITANDKVYNGTNIATLSTQNAALVGVLTGDAVTLNTTGATGTFASKDVGSQIQVSVSGLTLTGAQASDYVLTPPTTTASISTSCACRPHHRHATVSARVGGFRGHGSLKSPSRARLWDRSQGGGPLTVSWTVTNKGADTGNVPITDSLYLSLDPYFDPNSDRFVGYAAHPGGLAAGQSYSQQNLTFTLPAGTAGTYYVFVQTNSNQSVYEQDRTNNTSSPNQPVQVNLPPTAGHSPCNGQPLSADFHSGRNGNASSRLPTVSSRVKPSRQHWVVPSTRMGI